MTLSVETSVGCTNCVVLCLFFRTIFPCVSLIFFFFSFLLCTIFTTCFFFLATQSFFCLSWPVYCVLCIYNYHLLNIAVLDYFHLFPPLMVKQTFKKKPCAITVRYLAFMNPRLSMSLTLVLVAFSPPPQRIIYISRLSGTTGGTYTADITLAKSGLDSKFIMVGI